MVHSVELLLDPAAESAVRAQWAALAAAGLPSQAQHPGASNRPHITAAVADALSPEAEAALRALDFEPFPVTLGSTVVFGTRRLVLVRLVIPARALLAVHRRIHAAIGAAPGMPAHAEPDAWTPHVTLGRRLPPERLGEAVELIAADGDSPATVVGIRRWDGDRRRAWTVRGT